jgi:hypothetical protein
VNLWRKLLDSSLSTEALFDVYIALGRTTKAQKRDFLRQRAIFSLNKARVASHYPQHWVVVCNDQIFVSLDRLTAELAAALRFPRRALYIWEPR